MPLTDYTDDQLLEEIVRRQNARKTERPEQWCHDCLHFKVWDKSGDPPQSWNVCGKGHENHFYSPQDCDEAIRGEFGFYRRVCADRTNAA